MFKNTLPEFTQEIEGTYDEPFTVVDGAVVSFPDFILHLQGEVGLTEEEETEKRESQEDGIEGGPSMFTKSYQFRVLLKDGTEVTSFKVMYLPFVWVSFEVTGSTYTITPEDKDFVVWNGDLAYQRSKKFSVEE